ncbi:S-layer homology domain-containing protein [Fictibacillus sp. BK138]|uniref:S-layer homology domain-containing protein n=1 Tax=Fictibacillus sp. BK138 TaxID=2512121 RepID=UPI00102A28D9|nr:S-layer homology domain-containing protein [Fictibacillus sp. BK138]RZT21539.1 S-layer family protein [Fictibacillus sp. BK138]
MKKFIGGLLAATLLVSPFSQTAFAEEDPVEFADPYIYYAEDIDGHWAENDLNNMLQAKIIKGFKDEFGFLYVKPDDKITRAQFTSLIVRALELKTDKAGKAFSDTKTHWAKNDINTASALGIISGKTDTEFMPDMKITRAEIAAIIVRAFKSTVDFESGSNKSFTDLKSGHWAYNHVLMASKVGIIKGKTETKVYPDSDATRAEATAMLKRSLWLEGVELPDADAAMDLVINSEFDTVEAINNKDAETIFAVNETNRYGLAYEDAKLDAQIFELLFEHDQDVVVEIVSEPLTEVVDSSTRFIKVDVQDLVVDYYTIDPETGELYEVPETIDKSGEYYLIKRGGVWKVYTSDYLNNILYDEIDEEYLEEEFLDELE